MSEQVLNMNSPIVGILAGMGPRSTSPFIDLVIDECQSQYGAKFDIDFPQMIILSHPTPFYIDRPIDHNELKTSILTGLKKIENCGANFIAMPCNVAHVYYDELQASINIPILNIVAETLKQIPSKSKITLFATKPTFDSNVYQKSIEKSGCTLIFQESWQLEVSSIIKNIKEGQIDQAVVEWEKLIQEVSALDVDVIVSACTELNVVMRISQSMIPLVDSAKALAKATVENYLAELNKYL